MINRTQYHEASCCEKMFLRAVTFICPVQKVIPKGKCAIEWNLSGIKTGLTLRGSSANSIIAKAGRRIFKSWIQRYAEEHDRPWLCLTAETDSMWISPGILPCTVNMWARSWWSLPVSLSLCPTRERTHISNGYWSGCRWRAKCPA